MSEKTYYLRNIDVILNRAKDYYEDNKERLREKQEINTDTYLKNKKTKREYGKKRYHNMPEKEKKQRLKKNLKNYPKVKKFQHYNQ